VRDEMKIILLFLGLLLLNGCASSFLPNLTRAAIKKEQKELPKNPILMAENAELKRIENEKKFELEVIERTKESELTKISNEKKLEQKKVNSTPQGTPHSIDLNWDAIPKNYKNDNESFIDVFSRIQNLAKAKDEYETIDNFKSRTNNLISDEVYAYSVPFTAMYDANYQKWNIDIASTILEKYTPSRVLEKKTLLYQEPLKSGNDYKGVTAFGVVVDVGVSYIRQFVFDCFPPITDKIISFNMDSNSARSLGKQNIAVLLISKIKKGLPSNLATIIEERSKPTLDDPYVFNTTSYELSVELYQIWIYDKKTGKVLAKQFVHD
jgi:hypothetical protein